MDDEDKKNLIQAAVDLIQAVDDLLKTLDEPLA